VVNQLVTDYLEEPELNQLQEYAIDSMEQDATMSTVLTKALAAARLTTARRNIQSKYLKDLKSCPEVNRLPDPEDPKVKTNKQAGTKPLTVLEVPLLPSEVTGQKAILDFSHYLIGKDLSSTSAKSVGVEAEQSKKRRAAEAEATVQADKSTVTDSSKKKKVSKDMEVEIDSQGDMKKKAGGAIDAIMDDPELSAMVNESPKLKKIADEVKANPMAGLKYMSDPEVAPFLKKAMDKLMPGMSDMFGGMGGGSGGKQRKGKGKKEDPMAGLDAMMNGMGGMKDLLKGMPDLPEL